MAAFASMLKRKKKVSGFGDFTFFQPPHPQKC